MNAFANSTKLQAQRQSIHNRGYDVGQVVSHDAGASVYSVRILGRADADGSGIVHSDVGVLDARNEYYAGQYVNIVRVQGQVNRMTITGPASWSGSVEPTIVYVNLS